MSPTFTKGLLKGAALAVAGAAALGAGSAQAFSCNLSSLASCGGSIGNFTVPTGSVSLTGLGNMAGTVAFVLVDPLDPTIINIAFARDAGNTGGLSTNGNAAGSGSFNFTLNASTGFLKSYDANFQQLGTNNGNFDFDGPGITTTAAGFGGNIFGDFPIAPLSPVTGGAFTVPWIKTGGSSTSRLIGPNLTITSDVPVPLPIVGAGLAFGFTRKLRKRAQSLG